VDNDGRADRCFPTTHWSLVVRAGQVTSDAQRTALGELVRRYAPALRAHLIVRKRVRPQDADDLVQAFLAAKVVEQRLVGRADRDRGKFRTFLLTALDRFVANQFRHDTAQKRSAGAVELRDDLDGDSTADPSAAFDAAWAREVIAQAMRQMRGRYHAGGRDDIWCVFEGRVIAPMLDHTQPVPYDQLVERLGLRSPDEAWNLLATAKRAFASELRAVVGEYEKDDRRIEEEIADLRAVLARGSG
jgi:DNA-directed RNA polymerase specialized sigma24 family protein